MATVHSVSSRSSNNRRSTAGNKSAAQAKTAAKAAKNGAEAARASAVSASQLIAERYRDTSYESLVGPNGENVSAVMSAGEAMLSGMAEVSQEVMSFAGSRLREDLELAEELASAKSPEEIFEKQCSIARRAAEQYMAETSKLIGMMARIQQSCWAPMEERTKAALHGLSAGEDAKK